MGKMVNLIAVVEEAVQVGVTVPDINDYMNALTVIFNNVRDRHELLRVTNNSKNTIYVDCTPSNEKYVVDWLSQFGEVKVISKTLVYSVELPDDYDIDNYWDEFVISVD